MLHPAFQLKIKSLHRAFAQRPVWEGCGIFFFFFKQTLLDRVGFIFNRSRSTVGTGLQIPFRPQTVLQMKKQPSISLMKRVSGALRGLSPLHGDPGHGRVCGNPAFSLPHLMGQFPPTWGSSLPPRAGRPTFTSTYCVPGLAHGCRDQ